MAINGWRAMWIIAVYDCPMTQEEQRHDYNQFRRLVLQENFIQLQFSVYARHFASMETAQAAIKRLARCIPEGAKVAFFLITDKQFGMTREFFGPRRTAKSVSKPEQVELF